MLTSIFNRFFVKLCLDIDMLVHGVSHDTSIIKPKFLISHYPISYIRATYIGMRRYLHWNAILCIFEG